MIEQGLKARLLFCTKKRNAVMGLMMNERCPERLDVLDNAHLRLSAQIAETEELLGVKRPSNVVKMLRKAR